MTLILKNSKNIILIGFIEIKEFLNWIFLNINASNCTSLFIINCFLWRMLNIVKLQLNKKSSEWNMRRFCLFRKTETRQCIWRARTKSAHQTDWVRSFDRTECWLGHMFFVYLYFCLLLMMDGLNDCMIATPGNYFNYHGPVEVSFPV